MSTRSKHHIPAAYMLFEKENKILLMRRYNTPYANGMYSLPAGHVEVGESFLDTAIKEAKEEVGVVIDKKNCSVVHLIHQCSDVAPFEERIDVFVRISSWEGVPVNAEPHKCDDLQWFSYDALPENLLPYIKHALRQIKNDSFYSELGW